MNTNKINGQETENQDTEATDSFTGSDGYPNCEGEPCANMADKNDTVSEPGANPDAGEGETDGAGENLPQYEAALWKEKYMRLSAEYENYRKRTFKEKMDLIAAGGEDVVRSMLEVLDDMDRAMAAMASTDDMEAVKQGISLIDAKLRGALRSRGLAEIEALGMELDTDLHEAIARIETGEKEMKGKIIDVVQKGYKLKEKIIRYAKVVVGQ